jgi:hypothetical protein
MVIELLSMFTGKRFRLRTAALAQLDESRLGVTLPVDSVISVIDSPTPGKPLMRVVCEKRWFLMFEEDVRRSAEEIPRWRPRRLVPIDAGRRRLYGFGK